MSCFETGKKPDQGNCGSKDYPFGNIEYTEIEVRVSLEEKKKTDHEERKKKHYLLYILTSLS